MAKRFTAQFFSHDFNARGDEKIIKLLSKMGWVGYGLYWAIIEKLFENGGELENDYDSIAYDLRTKHDTIKNVVEAYNLFYIDNDKIRSYSVDFRMALVLEKSQKARDSVMNRYKKVTTVERTKHNRSTINKINKINKINENKKLPIVGDKTAAKVNWDNCNSNLQKIMKFWVKNFLPDLFETYTNGQYKKFISSNGNALSGILDSCMGNAQHACNVIQMASDNYNKLGIGTWTLHAVNRNADDYFNEIKRKEKIKNANN